MASIDWSVPTLPFISTVTSQPETRFDTDYGWLNLRRPVGFQAAIETALDLGATTFLELGPAATLAGPTKSTALEAGATVTVLKSINRKEDNFDAMAQAAATLFVEGYPLKWRAITGTPDVHVPLPQNVWIEEEFWQDSEESRELLHMQKQHPFLGFAEHGHGSTWNSEINLRAYPYLTDHRMQSETLFPAAGYLDTMIALCREQFGPDKPIELENAVIHEALAHYRTSLGLAGTAIDWGVIADVGFVTRNAGLASHLESVGQFGLTHKDAGVAMDVAIAREAPAFLFARADWAQVARANQTLGNSPRMSGLLMNESGGTTQIRAKLMQLDGDALLEAAEDYIKDEITSVLKIEKSTIQAERPMSELGLDSLSSFELKVRIETALDSSIPVSKFLQAPSISELAVMLAGEISSMQKSEAAALLASDDADAATGDAGTRVGDLASNAQLGLLRDALSPMTSDLAKAAMEHHVTLRLSETCAMDGLQKAIRKLERRHPLLKSRIDGEGVLHLDGPGVTVTDGQDDSLLDVAKNEFARLSLTTSGDASMLHLKVHSIVADRASADLLAREIKMVLDGKDLGKPVSKRAILSMLADARFDGEDPTSQRDRSFWRYALLAERAAPVPFAKRCRALLPPSLGRNHGTAGVVQTSCKTKTDLPTLLMTLALSIRSATKSEGALVMGLKRSVRDALPGETAIGPFDIEQTILAPQPEAGSLATRQFERTSNAAAQHGRFDSHAAAVEFKDEFAGWGITPFQVLVETGTDFPDTVPVAPLHDLWFQVAQTGSGVTVRVINDTDVVDQTVALVAALCLFVLALGTWVAFGAILVVLASATLATFGFAGWTNVALTAGHGHKLHGCSGPRVDQLHSHHDQHHSRIGKRSERHPAEIRDRNQSGTCHVIDRVPKTRSGYSRQRIWLDTAELRLQQVQYFDRRGAHLKTLLISGYRQYDGRFWRASQMDMVNHLTGASTRLTWGDYKFDQGLQENAFTVNALRRIR